MTKKTVTFICDPDKRTVSVEVDPGETLVQAAYRAEVLIQQTCGGTPSCTDCRVRVQGGDINALEPMEGPESRLTGNVFHITFERLACQAKVRENCTILVPVPPERKKTQTRKGTHRYGQESQKKGSEKSDQKSREKSSQEKSHQKSGQKNRR